MKAVSFALVYLASASFFGVEAAKLDVASDFKRRWSKWALSRARRDLTFSSAAAFSAGQAADANVPSVIRTQDVKGESGMAQPSHPEDVRIRVKRYRQSVNSISRAMRTGCRLGTCNTHNLQQTLFNLNDKDKDSHHPPKKISAQGYGRKRRSLPEPLESRRRRRRARTLPRLLASLPASAPFQRS